MIKMITPLFFVLLFATGMDAQSWVPKAENSDYKVSAKVEQCTPDRSVVLFYVVNKTGQDTDVVFDVTYDDKSMKVDQTVRFENVKANSVMTKDCNGALSSPTGYGVIFPEGASANIDNFHVQLK